MTHRPVSPSPEAPLRVALIGAGYWGPNYARTLHDLGSSELAWVCDLEESKLDLLRRRYPAAGATTDVVEVLDDPTVDAVVISTPTSTHAPIALAALSAGKHVLCEKPLAATVEECDTLALAAERADRRLMVGHTFIFNPAVARMKELIDAGEVGDVLYCDADRTGLGPIRQDVNALWDLAPHDISILLHLLGRPAVEVAAQGQSFLREGTEDVVFLTIRFDGGLLANVHLSWLNPYKVRKLTVVGDRRMIVFDDIAADEKLRVFDRGASYEAPSEAARGTGFGDYRAVVRHGDIVAPRIAPAEPLKEQVAHFVHCCRTGDRPLTDVASARAVTAVLEAASRSLAQGGAPVWLEGRPAKPRAVSATGPAAA